MRNVNGWNARGLGLSRSDAAHAIQDKNALPLTPNCHHQPPLLSSLAEVKHLLYELKWARNSKIIYLYQ